MALTFAQGSRSQLLYKLQTDFLTQATGNFTKARFNSHTLNFQKGTIEGGEIRSDRMVQDFRHGQGNNVGDVVVDLCYNDHQKFLESMAFNAFATSTLNIGTTPQYLSLEDGALDIDKYRMFVGCSVTKATIDIQPKAMVKATFSMIGGDMIVETATAGGTPVAAGVTDPFDSFNAGVYTDNAASGNKLQNVSGITIQKATSQVGYKFPQALEFGRARVTGTLKVFYTDNRFIDYFKSEVESALFVNLTDPQGNTLSFNMPRIKYNDAAAPIASEQSRMVTLPFIALNSSGAELTITK